MSSRSFHRRVARRLLSLLPVVERITVLKFVRRGVSSRVLSFKHDERGNTTTKKTTVSKTVCNLSPTAVRFCPPRSGLYFVLVRRTKIGWTFLCKRPDDPQGLVSDGGNRPVDSRYEALHDVIHTHRNTRVRSFTGTFERWGWDQFFGLIADVFFWFFFHFYRVRIILSQSTRLTMARTWKSTVDLESWKCFQDHGGFPRCRQAWASRIWSLLPPCLLSPVACLSCFSLIQPFEDKLNVRFWGQTTPIPSISTPRRKYFRTAVRVLHTVIDTLRYGFMSSCGFFIVNTRLKEKIRYQLWDGVFRRTLDLQAACITYYYSGVYILTALKSKLWCNLSLNCPAVCMFVLNCWCGRRRSASSTKRTGCPCRPSGSGYWPNTPRRRTNRKPASTASPSRSDINNTGTSRWPGLSCLCLVLPCQICCCLALVLRIIYFFLVLSWIVLICLVLSWIVFSRLFSSCLVLPCLAFALICVVLPSLGTWLVFCLFVLSCLVWCPASITVICWYNNKDNASKPRCWVLGTGPVSPSTTSFLAEGATKIPGYCRILAIYVGYVALKRLIVQRKPIEMCAARRNDAWRGGKAAENVPPRSEWSLCFVWHRLVGILCSCFYVTYCCTRCLLSILHCCASSLHIYQSTVVYSLAADSWTFRDISRVSTLFELHSRFGGQTGQISSNLSPKRGYIPTRVKYRVMFVF